MLAVERRLEEAILDGSLEKEEGSSSAAACNKTVSQSAAQSVSRTVISKTVIRCVVDQVLAVERRLEEAILDGSLEEVEGGTT